MALTAEKAHELFDYNEETGVIRWKISQGKARVGQVAGSLNERGYRVLVVTVDGNREKCKAHRLAWLLVYGEWPSDDIDHINHCRDDNRRSNLRGCLHVENPLNQARNKNNRSGYTGVWWSKATEKWRAYITIKGKTVHLGSYQDITDAVSARKEANKEHGFHDNHGEPIERHACSLVVDWMEGRCQV